MSTDADADRDAEDGGLGQDAAQEQDGEQEQERGRRRGPWTVPVTATVLGGAFLAIYLGQHNVGMAIAGLLIMVAYAAVLVFGSRRSEAVSLLRGENGDERSRSIEQRASSLTLHVLAVVLVGGYVVALIRGTGEMTWASLCGVLGGTYMLSTVVLTRRG